MSRAAEPLILAIDLGTTDAKSGLFTIDPQGRTVLYGKFAASRPSELAPAATPNAR